jgi:hypothetical protein
MLNTIQNKINKHGKLYVIAYINNVTDKYKRKYGTIIHHSYIKIVFMYIST